MSSLTDCMPKVLLVPEEELLSSWFTLTKDAVWSPEDLIEWLDAKFDLPYEEASVFTDHLIDIMIDKELGDEFGGITPWGGDGYYFYGGDS